MILLLKYFKVLFNYSSDASSDDQSNVGWTYYNKVMVRYTYNCICMI